MLGKNHLFLTPSRTDRRVPSEQGAPTRTLQPDLLGSFPADVCPKITGQFNLGLIIARINTTQQVLQTTNPLRHPALSLSQQHFPCKDISFFPNVPAIKTLIACRTDIMRSRSIGPSLQSYMTSLGSEHSSQFSTNQSIIAEFGRALLLQVTKRLICRKVCFRRLIKFQVKKQTNKQTNKQTKKV